MHRPNGTYLKFITALVVQNTAGHSVAGALETVNSLTAEASSCGGPFGGDHRRLKFSLFASGRCYRGGSFGSLGGLHIHLLLSVLTSPLVAKLNLALPLSIQQSVPEDEERLRKVGLDAPALVMNVVIGSVVGGEVLQGIPWESVAAMIVNGLDGRAGEEPHRLTVGHSRD